MAQKIEIEISARLDQAVAQMKVMQEQLNAIATTTQKSAKQVDSGLQKISSSAIETNNSLSVLKNGAMSLLGAFGLYAGAGVVVDFFRESARAGIAFESTLRSINAILPEGQRVTEATAKSFKDLAETFGLSAQTQAKAYYEILQAGIKDTAKIQDLLVVSNKAAVAGLTDIATTAGVLSSVLNAYAKSNLTATRATDALFQAVVEGQTTFQELSGTIGRVTPIAAAANISIEEVAGSIAFLTKSGIQTDEAVTGLRQAISDIIKPTQQAQQLAKQLGIDFSVSALQSKGFAGVMDEVRIKTGGSQEAIALLFQDIKAQVAATSILEGNWEDYVSVLSSVQNAAGATQKAFDEQNKSLESQLRRLSEEWNNLKTTVGEAVVPVLLKAVYLFKQVGSIAKDAANSISAFIDRGGLLGAIFGVPKAIQDKIAAQNKIIEQTKNDIKQVNAEARKATIQINKQTEEERKANAERAKALAQQINAGRQAKDEALKARQELEKSFNEAIKNPFTIIIDKYAPKLKKSLEESIGGLKNAGSQLALGFGAIAAKGLAAGEAGFSNIITGAIQGVGAAIGPAGAAIAGVVTPIVELLGKSEEQVRETIRAFADGAVTFVENLITNIPVLIEELVNAVPRIIDRFISDLPRIIDSFIAEGIPKIASSLAAQMPVVATQFAISLIAEAPNIAAALIKAIPQAAGGAVGGIGGSVGGFLKKLRFAEGGQIVSVPSGFPNDTFPARLTSGELVVDRSTAFRLKEFLNVQQKQEQTKTTREAQPMGDIVVSIDGREIARAVRSQVKQGFAL